MKSFIISLIIFSSYTTLSAQSFEPYIIGGIQGSQIDGDGFGGYYKGGLKAGTGLIIPSEKIDYNIEITFSREGMKSTQKQTPYLTEFTSNYIDLALLGKKEFYPGFNFYFGGQFGYLLSAKDESQGSITNFTPHLKPIDICYEIGASYKINESWEIVIKQSRSILTTRKDLLRQYNNNLGVYLKVYF